jgi:hypothetical protein
MGRLRRFEDYRFLGRRDQMRFYDCDDEAHLAELEPVIGELTHRNLIQTFAPDTPEEAANRGFKLARRANVV